MSTIVRPALTSLALCVCALSLHAQSLALDWVEVSGHNVIVHYNLEDNNSNNQYLVNLFTSKDNFAAPLTRVTGDVGTEVKPGMNKKITWDITQEVGAFKGNLTFEVRGRVFIPFVRLVDFSEGKVFKRTRNYPITWTSGNLSGQINIELFRDQERIMGENNLPNNGKYDWYIPGSVKKGNNYRLKFTNTKDRNDIQYSRPFTIKPKTPFIIKAMGVFAAGAAIIVIQGGKKGSTGTTVIPEDPLPPNPGLPN